MRSGYPAPNQHGSLKSVAGDVWDAVVVGAGPAGSVAARELARLGMQVLLVDRKAFPRSKVCGACLNGRTLSVLEAIGLGGLAEACGAVPLTEFRLCVRHRQATLRLPEGRALSRARFDAALVDEAVRSGVEFQSETHATLVPCDDERIRPVGRIVNPSESTTTGDGSDVRLCRTDFQSVRQGRDGPRQLSESRLDGLEIRPTETTTPFRRLVLRRGGESVSVSARVVLAADGLAGGLTAHEPRLGRRVSPWGRIGAGTVAVDSPPQYNPGTIFMAVGSEGYVGLVQVETGSLNIAAALERRAVKEAGGPAHCVAGLLKRAGLPAVPALAELAWQGTAPLTRQVRSPAGERLFLLGDAAGYVEPFTGEGIAWGLSAAVAVAPFVQQGVSGWTPALIDGWTREHRRVVGRRQWMCRGASIALRHPNCVALLVELLSRVPALAGPWVRRLNRPLAKGSGR